MPDFNPLKGPLWSNVLCALLLAVCLVVAGAPARAQDGPSYDCNRARLDTEFAICRDRGLSSADVVMARLFREVFRSKPAREQGPFREEQLLWQRWRNSCGADVPCLRARYGDRIDDFNRALGRAVIVGTSGPGPDEVVEMRVRDNRFERVYGDGRIEWDGGGCIGTDLPDGTGSIACFQEVSPDDFPELPPSANDWVAELERSLVALVESLLPPEDHAEYHALIGFAPLDQRMFQHVDAISFLTSQ